MNTAWYVLRITDDDETLMRCSPTGFETVPIRPAQPDQRDPELAQTAIPAATPAHHSPLVPTDVGAMADDAAPRATRVVDDLSTETDPTTRYLRKLGTSVKEAIRPQPAPLYVAMDEDRAALFQTLSRTPVRAFVYDQQQSLSTLWSDTRAMEINQ